MVGPSRLTEERAPNSTPPQPQPLDSVDALMKVFGS